MSASNVQESAHIPDMHAAPRCVQPISATSGCAEEHAPGHCGARIREHAPSKRVHPMCRSACILSKSTPRRCAQMHKNNEGHKLRSTLLGITERAPKSVCHSDEGIPCLEEHACPPQVCIFQVRATSKHIQERTTEEHTLTSVRLRVQWAHAKGARQVPRTHRISSQDALHEAHHACTQGAVHSPGAEHVPQRRCAHMLAPGVLRACSLAPRALRPSSLAPGALPVCAPGAVCACASISLHARLPGIACSQGVACTEVIQCTLLHMQSLL